MSPEGKKRGKAVLRTRGPSCPLFKAIRLSWNYPRDKRGAGGDGGIAKINIIRPLLFTSNGPQPICTLVFYEKRKAKKGGRKEKQKMGEGIKKLLGARMGALWSNFISGNPGEENKKGNLLDSKIRKRGGKRINPLDAEGCLKFEVYFHEKVPLPILGPRKKEGPLEGGGLGRGEMWSTGAKPI